MLNLNVTVLGSGAMGSQIAFASAMAGYSVKLYDLSKDILNKSKENLVFNVNKYISKGKLNEKSAIETYEKIQYIDNLELSLKDADLVIEAIVENEDIKREMFEKIEPFVSRNCIITSNSSTIVSSKLAANLKYKNRVCNMHFFNPAILMELVEVVKGPHTADETAQKVVDFVVSLGKTPVLLKKEIPGFVVNRILGKLLDEAIFLYENEIASFEEIDIACVKGLNHPMGPFKLMDMTGIDVFSHFKTYLYNETGLESEKPQELIIQKVQNGEFGRKKGQGFYSYS